MICLGLADWEIRMKKIYPDRPSGQQVSLIYESPLLIKFQAPG